MQWTSGRHAGFTTGDPWLAANPNARTINVAAQAADPDSVMSHYRRLIDLRREHPELIFGAPEVLDPGHQRLIAYRRGGHYLVLLNFSREPAEFTASPKALLISSDGEPEMAGGVVRLRGWQSAVYRI